MPIRDLPVLYADIVVSIRVAALTENVRRVSLSITWKALESRHLL
jgi:hypothetical protein